jgi:two-component system, sensor histidine kinase and response regulator
MNFDIETFNLIITGLSILQSLFLLIYHIFMPYIKGPEHWFWGYLISGIGFLLLSFNGIIDDFFCISVAQTLFLIGQVFGIMGLWSYKNKKFNWYIILILPLSGFIISTIFSVFYVNHEIRTILITLLYICYGIININELKTPDSKVYKNTFSFLSIVFILYTLAMFIRIGLVAYTHLVNIMTPNIISILVFVVTMILQFGVFFGFLMLINTRISDNLTQNINAKNKFFSIIAHDLKGPISSISDALKLLTEYKENINLEEMNDLILEMKEQSTNTYNLLENLLDWARNESGTIKINKQKINLKSIVDNTLNILSYQAKQKKIAVINDVHIDTTIFADLSSISTILRNLLSNSLKFTNDNGKIIISDKTENDLVEISISDNGIGISKERIKKLLTFGENETTFGTKGEKGTGLGLILCNELIKKNDGSFAIDSIENEGTTFKITLQSQA